MKNTKISLFLLLCAVAFSAAAQVEYKPKPIEQPKPAEPAKINDDTDDEPLWKGPPRQNIIKVNLLSPIYGTIMMAYQHNVRKDASFQIGFGYMDFNGFYGTYDKEVNPSDFNSPVEYKYDFEENTKAFFITPEYRFMIFGSDMRGFYVAPFAKYMYMNYQENYGKDTTHVYVPRDQRKFLQVQDNYIYHTLGLGATIGQQLIFKNRVSLEYFVGPVYNILLSSSDHSTSTSDPVVSDVMPTLIVRGYGVRAGFTLGFLF